MTREQKIQKEHLLTFGFSGSFALRISSSLILLPGKHHKAMLAHEKLAWPNLY
jgi:hypothetical protein